MMATRVPVVVAVLLAEEEEEEAEHSWDQVQR